MERKARVIPILAIGNHGLLFTLFNRKTKDIALKNKGNQNAGSPQNPTPQGQPKKIGLLDRFSL